MRITIRIAIVAVLLLASGCEFLAGKSPTGPKWSQCVVTDTSWDKIGSVTFEVCRP